MSSLCLSSKDTVFNSRNKRHPYKDFDRTRLSECTKRRDMFYILPGSQTMSVCLFVVFVTAPLVQKHCQHDIHLLTKQDTGTSLSSKWTTKKKKNIELLVCRDTQSALHLAKRNSRSTSWEEKDTCTRCRWTGTNTVYWDGHTTTGNEQLFHWCNF